MRPTLSRKLSALRPLLIEILEMHRNNVSQRDIAKRLNENLKPGEKRYYQVRVHRLKCMAEDLEADGLLYRNNTVGATMAANAHRNLSIPAPPDEELRRAAIEGLQYFREA